MRQDPPPATTQSPRITYSSGLSSIHVNSGNAVGCPTGPSKPPWNCSWLRVSSRSTLIRRALLAA